MIGVERPDEADSLGARRRVRRAAELKSKHPIGYADAFAVATAVELNATLLTGDPEIRAP